MVLKMERHRRPIISSLWLTAHTFLILWAYIIHPSIWMLKRDLLRLLASACFYFVCGCTRSAVRSDETTRATLRRHASLHMMELVKHSARVDHLRGGYSNPPKPASWSG